MGFLDWLGGSGTGLLGSVAGSVVSGLFGNKQNKQNIQAQQAENAKDRAFNAEQAQLSREWQEMMYNKYESPVAQAQARRQAGLPVEASFSPVGSSSTASAGSSALPAPASPWTGLGESIKQLPFIRQQIKQQKLETALKQEQLLQSISDTTIKSIEAATSSESAKLALEEANERINGLRIDNEHKDVLRKQAQLTYDKQKEAFDKGINEYVDEHNWKQAQTTTENLLRMPRKAQIEADTIMKNIAAEIEDKYGRQLKSLEVETSSELLRKIKTEVEEYVRSTGYRMRIIRAGASEAEADALISSTAATIESIDANYLEALTGSGDDWYSPLGMLLYALWSKDGIALKFGK